MEFSFAFAHAAFDPREETLQWASFRRA